jgi:dimethylaniline monooxygenase (N-oxide forming)
MWTTITCRSFDALSTPGPRAYFIGLVQPLGAIMPIAELQSEWVADLFDGSAALPESHVMKREIEREEAAMRKRYVASTRHTIQVDYYPYMRLLGKERKRRRGVKRSLPRTRGSFALPPGWPDGRCRASPS